MGWPKPFIYESISADAKSLIFSRHLHFGHKRHLFCSLLSLHPRWAGVRFWMVQTTSLMEVRTELCHIAENSKGGVVLFFQTQVKYDKRKKDQNAFQTHQLPVPTTSQVFCERISNLVELKWHTESWQVLSVWEEHTAERDFYKSEVDHPFGDCFQKKSLTTICVLLISVVVPPGHGLNQRVWKGRHLNLGPHVCTPRSLTCSAISSGPPNTCSFVKYENFRSVYTVTTFILLKVTKAITHIGSSLGAKLMHRKESRKMPAAWKHWA